MSEGPILREQYVARCGCVFYREHAPLGDDTGISVEPCRAHEHLGKITERDKTRYLTAWPPTPLMIERAWRRARG